MLLGVGLRGNTKRRFAMTSTVLHQALTTVVALTLAATCAGAPAFAKDFSKGHVLSTQFAAPKANRVGAPVFANDVSKDSNFRIRVSTQFVAPKANPVGPVGGQVFTTKILVPKSNPVLRVTPKAPVAEFVAPKAPRDNSNDSRITTAKFVAPKAPRGDQGDQTVVASIEQPQPLLLVPATSTPAVAADQGSPVPAEASTDEASTPVAESQTAPVAADTTDSQVAVAHLRAAQHYGYGYYASASYQASDEGYDETDSDNSYEDSDSSYSSQGYGDDNCN
jgi:hypothetical protein